MRPYAIFLSLLLFLGTIKTSYSQQINFQDGFEDGNFTTNPTWNGDTADFTVVEDSPNYLLQLDAASSPAYLSTSSTNITGIWKFYIEFRGFEPSGSNQATIFLMSDIANLEGPVNGYAVQVGQSGDDFFKIVRYDNGSQATTVLTDTTVVQGGAGYTLKVIHNQTGNWQIEVGKGYGGPLYDSGNTGTDNTYSSASYFGPKVDFTSSRSDKFFFDFKIDLPPFVTTDAKLSSAKTIDMAFNRAIDQATVSKQDLSLDNGLGAPASLSFPAADTIRLIYNQPLPSNQYILSVSGISDQSGNPIATNDQESFTVFGKYSDGDVKISEFMYDPPSGQAEYIEIKNTSSKYLNLSNWQIGDNSNKDILYSSSISLKPHSLLVISADTTALFNSYGHRPYWQSYHLPSLNNGGDAVRILTDTGALADSLTYQPDWGGQKMALERRSISTSATYSENWGDSPSNLGGTPGLPNEIAPDTAPPKLTFFDIISDKIISLGFDERLDFAPASDVSNYVISNSSIGSVQVTAPDTVQLSLETNLKNAQDYSLSISGAEDVFGNSITQIDTSFTFYKISPADSGDIAINEFMYSPSNSTEYIELYNHSDKSLNLQDWTLSDNRHNTSLVTDSGFIVPPDSFAVLAPDNSLKKDFPDINLVSMGDHFPALNNGGDQIIIRNGNGNLLDSLEYNSSWGGDEVALERRSTALAANYRNNWADSPNGFGTPGQKNEATPDSIPPSLENLSVRDSHTIILQFSERLEKSTAQDTHNYNLSGGAVIDKATISAPDSVSLTLAGNLQNATDYMLSLKNISDIFGNAMSPSDTLFTYYKISNVDSGDVFINEFNYDPADGSTEYVELYNPTSKSFDLKNWALSDNRGLNAIISSSPFIVPPDSFVVIAPDNSMLANNPNISLVVMPDFPSLNNSGDAIILRDTNGNLLDSLQYSSKWGGNEVALERRTISTTAIYQENWGNSPSGGSPGNLNKIGKDKTPPKLTTLHIVGAQKLKLAFSERLDDSAYQPTNYKLTNAPISFVQKIAADTLSLSLKSNLQNAQTYTLSISGLKDIFGNIIAQTDTTFTFYKVSPADSGDVVINEFMYQPPPNSTEYIELYNHSNKSLDLKGWTLSDNRHNSTLIADYPVIVPPNSFVVLAPDNTILQDYPDINLISMGSRFPALNNSNDQIIIRDSSGILLDSLQYSSNWGGDEVALERRSLSIPGGFKENWGNSPSPDIGTPGQTNRVAQDRKPPQLISFTISGGQKLQLHFDERLDETTAIPNTNYSITNADINAVHIIDPSSVLVKLNTALQNVQQYTLSISGVSDIFGNAVKKIDTTFTYYQISQADSGDVAINEFMYAPPSSNTEYVELYNYSDKSFNLEGWTISDNHHQKTLITNQKVIVPPDSFAVIAPDSTIKEQKADILFIDMENNFPSLNNNQDQIIIRDSNGTLLDSLEYHSFWGGDEVALERRTTNVSGVFKENWNDSPNPNGGTPGRANNVEPDKQPPYLTAFKIINDKNIRINFDESLDKISASEKQNYNISNNIISNVILKTNSVFLSLKSAFQNTHQYTLDISGLTDIFGNAVNDQDTTFTFYKVSPVDSGDVSINEFMYAPPSNSTEYIELFNHSGKSLDLKGWMLSDSRHDNTRITNQPVIVPPDSFAVLAPDNTILHDYPDINLISMGSNFPALNNSSDQIIIRDSTGALLDSLQYNSAWGSEEVALERKTTTISATFAENWGIASNDYGSPGFINGILADTSPPVLRELYSLDPSTLKLIFSERISASSAALNHYSISSDIGISLVSVKEDTVTLYLNKPLTSGQTYTFMVSNIADIFGNTLTQATKDLKFIKIDKAQSGDIVLNEIMYNPAPDQADFVELYNKTDKNIDLANWFIGDATGTSPITKSVILKSHHYLILTGNRKFAQGYKNAVAIADFPSLNDNRSDALYVQRQDSTTIDSLYYYQSWGGSQEGTSMERRDPFDASNDASNWETSSSEKNYSAGQQNASFHFDTNPPSVIFAKISSNGDYEVRFSEFIKRTPELEFSSGGKVLTIERFDSTRANIIYLHSAGSKMNKKPARITVEHLSDVKGNVLDNAEIAVAQSPKITDLVINEIMYNPLNNADDNRPDQSEYIELHNTQDYAISLEGLVLHDAPDEHGDLRELQPVTSTAKWVPAQGYALIYADNASQFANSNIAQYFDLTSPENRSILQIDRSSLSLASNDDAIFIADSTGTTIDSVYFNESWQNPNIFDTKGIALERIDPNGPSNDESNWSSSVNPKGGTPDKENSIYQANKEQSTSTGISFNPNPFSPDDDGYDDNLFVNYKLDQQDYLIRVRIYDRYGRLVRELADGKPAGFEGQLIWDGRKNNGGRNHIGIYIVVFEAYDSAAGDDEAYKKTVVLARKLN